MPFTLGLDLGTSAIKAVVFNTNSGLIATSANISTPVSHSKPGWSEHDPETIWQTIADLISRTVQGYTIDAVGVSSFAEAGLPLDRDMQPLFPIIAWYDERAKPQMKTLIEGISEEEIFDLTGQKAGFSFGLLKILWLKETNPGLFQRIEKWLSVPDYILYRLCGKIATDYTQASRTLMFDQSKKQWSEDMMRIADLPKEKLPDIVPSGTALGTVSQDSSKQTGLGTNTICVAGGHDHLCGAFACGGFESGSVVDSMGTSQAVIMITNDFSPSLNMLKAGFVHYAHVAADKYLIKGGLKTAGRALQWAQNIFGVDLTKDNPISLTLYSSNLPYWLPSFQGSGTPNRRPDARALLYGLHTNHSRESILLALLESFAFWLRLNFESITSISGIAADKVISIGGANQNKTMQTFKASLLNKTLHVPKAPEASALGAALLAALGGGIVKSYREAVELNRYPTDLCKPDLRIKKIIEKRYKEGFIPLRDTNIEIYKN